MDFKEMQQGVLKILKANTVDFLNDRGFYPVDASMIIKGDSILEFHKYTTRLLFK